MLPFLFAEVFDCIPERGAGHGARMLVEKLAKRIFPNSLPYLSEHPTDSLMDEIVFVVQQYFCDREYFLVTSCADEGEG